MTQSTHAAVTAPLPHRASARPFTRWLLVAGVVAFVGVSIDLFKGPPARALSAPPAPSHALAALPLDHSVVTKLADADPLVEGASVAAYESPALDAAATMPAPAARSAMADDALQAGASVAVYGD